MDSKTKDKIVPVCFHFVFLRLVLFLEEQRQY